MSWIDDRLMVGGDIDLWPDDKFRADVDFIIDIRNWFLYRGQDCWPGSLMSERVEVISGLADRGWKLFIRCAGGIDRSPFVAALYYAKRHGVSLEEAYRVVKEKRPQTLEHPEWFEFIPRWLP